MLCKNLDPSVSSVYLLKHFVNDTGQNTKISPNFLAWKFLWESSCESPETVPFHKISTTGNQVKLRYLIMEVSPVLYLHDLTQREETLLRTMSYLN